MISAVIILSAIFAKSIFNKQTMLWELSGRKWAQETTYSFFRLTVLYSV